MLIKLRASESAAALTCHMCTPPDCIHLSPHRGLSSPARQPVGPAPSKMSLRDKCLCIYGYIA